MGVETIEVKVADLADVIRSKEAAGRPKDLEVLPALYRFERARRAVEKAPGPATDRASRVMKREPARPGEGE